MKKMLTSAVVLAVFSTPTIAANLENPLYMPTSGELYSKTSAGIMYIKTDGNLARQAKDYVGAIEFPVWRIHEDIGVGITDWLTLRGSFTYTHNGDIERQGLSNGRIGLNFRASEFLPTDGWVWDIYADAQMGGLSKMNADLVASKNPGIYPLSFNYDNYSNGRWGAWLGTQVGKTWGKFTGAAFVEAMHTFGNSNNKITVTPSGKDMVEFLVDETMHPIPLIGEAFASGLPDSFKVETKSTWEYNIGLRGLYEIDSKWSVGGAFTYKNRAANKVEKVKAKVDTTAADATLELLKPGLPLDVQYAIENGLLSGQTITEKVMSDFLGSMYDGIEEYIFTLSVAHQLNEIIQVAVYGEYTFDDAMIKSQNGTDIKWETGVRLNVRF
ncbi:MAG: hypothetical protein FWG80_00955 [Alphaproteobacteria bacterium]|nr:hypothetical protein [Alphaproteobacteria bacterium]